MKLKFLKSLVFVIFFNFFLIHPSFSEIIKKIEVKGNERISDEIVIMFSEKSEGDNFELNDLNLILLRFF